MKALSLITQTNLFSISLLPTQSNQAADEGVFQKSCFLTEGHSHESDDFQGSDIEADAITLLGCHPASLQDHLWIYEEKVFSISSFIRQLSMR